MGSLGLKAKALTSLSAYLTDDLCSIIVTFSENVELDDEDKVDGDRHLKIGCKRISRKPDCLGKGKLTVQTPMNVHTLSVT